MCQRVEGYEPDATELSPYLEAGAELLLEYLGDLRLSWQLQSELLTKLRTLAIAAEFHKGSAPSA